MVVKKVKKKINSKSTLGTMKFTQKVDWKPGTMGTSEKPWEQTWEDEKSVFKLLVHQWQFWLLVAVFVIVVVAAVINESQVINKKDVQSGQSFNQPVRGNQSAQQETPLNDTIASWLGLLVVIIMIGLIVGIFIALLKIFR